MWCHIHISESVFVLVEIVEFVNFILLIYCCVKIYYSEKMSNCESKISQAGFIKRRNAKQINIQQSTINRFM